MGCMKLNLLAFDKAILGRKEEGCLRQYIKNKNKQKALIEYKKEVEGCISSDLAAISPSSKQLP